MSAIIELKDNSDETYEKLEKTLKEKNFFVDAIAESYVAVRCYENRGLYFFESLRKIAKLVLNELTEGHGFDKNKKNSEKLILPPYVNLSDYENAVGRVIITFNSLDSAEKYLANQTIKILKSE